MGIGLGSRGGPYVVTPPSDVTVHYISKILQGGCPPPLPLLPMYATTLRECLASYSVSQRPAFWAFTASGLDK